MQALFRAAPLRTRRTSFPVTGSPVTYFMTPLVGFTEWIASWQPEQTTRVLRRFFAMTWHHSVGGSPLLRSASFRMWCTRTSSGVPHSLHFPRESRVISSLLGRGLAT